MNHADAMPSRSECRTASSIEVNAAVSVCGCCAVVIDSWARGNSVTVVGTWAPDGSPRLSLLLKLKVSVQRSQMLWPFMDRSGRFVIRSSDRFFPHFIITSLLPLPDGCCSQHPVSILNDPLCIPPQTASNHQPALCSLCLTSRTSALCKIQPPTSAHTGTQDERPGAFESY